MNNIESDETVNTLVKQIIGKQELLEALPKSLFGEANSSEILQVKRELNNEIRELQNVLMDRCKELREEK